MSVRARRASSRRWGRRGDRGAAAVEFALVSPLVFMLIFATVDYGLYFADALSVEQGVSDAARDATLSVNASSLNWSGNPSCLPTGGVLDTGLRTDLANVACQLTQTVQPIGGGTIHVKALIVDSSGDPVSTGDWRVGNRLRVCAEADRSAVFPLIPLPDGGAVTARTDMPIQPGGPDLQLSAVTTDPTGMTWC